MNNVSTFKIICQQVARELDIPLKVVMDIVKRFSALAPEYILDGRRLRLPGFGIFKIGKHIANMRSRLPYRIKFKYTGEPVNQTVLAKIKQQEGRSVGDLPVPAPLTDAPDPATFEDDPKLGFFINDKEIV